MSPQSVRSSNRKASAPKKAKPAVKKQPWKSFLPETFQIALGEAVHFSGKNLNTMAQAGVRITPAQCTEVADLPYIAVSTLHSLAEVPFDQGVPPNLDELRGQKMQAQLRPLRQAMDFLWGKPPEKYEPAPEEQSKIVREAFEEALNTPFEQPEPEVDRRLRQIIVQDENGADLVITPLSSGGFSSILNARLLAEAANWAVVSKQLDLSRARLSRPRAYLGYGGANPQNAGLHARARGQPLVFGAPCEQPEVRRAYAFHHKGFRLVIRWSLLREYHEWRASLVGSNHGEMPSTMEYRAYENDWVRRVTASVQRDAKEAAHLLDANRERLPGEALTSSRLGPVMRGLLDPTTRGKEWVTDTAAHIYSLMLGTRFKDGEGKEQFLGFVADGPTRWLNEIEEALKQ